MDLSKISGPIEAELAEFEVKFKESLHSSVALAEQVMSYLSMKKGKRLRPMLVFLTALLHGVINERTMKAAVVVELLHTATLIHDDVVDVSPLRRGVPTVNSVWTNKISILVGDYLFARSLAAIVSLGEPQALAILIEATERMTEGELLQIERSQDHEMSEEVYFRLIGNKTGSLLAAACGLGAFSTLQDREQVKQMKDFGETLGIAFQIKDDLLDYTGTEKILGKPVGNDIRENKITLPLIAALRNASPEESQMILSKLGDGATNDNVNQILDFVQRNGGLAYAEQESEKYIRKATTFLENFSPSPARESLFELINFVTRRDV